MKVLLSVALCGTVCIPVTALGASMIALWTDQTSFNPSVAIEKDAAARAAWHKVVPSKYRKARWVYLLEGNFNPPKVMSESGTTYVVGGNCKPDDCMTYNNYYVIQPGGHKAFGAVLVIKNNVPVYEYFGRADSVQHEWLREEIVDTLRHVGISQPVN